MSRYEKLGAKQGGPKTRKPSRSKVHIIDIYESQFEFQKAICGMTARNYITRRQAETRDLSAVCKRCIERLVDE